MERGITTPSPQAGDWREIYAGQRKTHMFSHDGILIHFYPYSFKITWIFILLVFVFPFFGGCSLFMTCRSAAESMHQYIFSIIYYEDDHHFILTSAQHFMLLKRSFARFKISTHIYCDSSKYIIDGILDLQSSILFGIYICYDKPISALLPHAAKVSNCRRYIQKRELLYNGLCLLFSLSANCALLENL